ncbi:hypothetical protein FDJ19_gp093 [Vibrio phage Ceto]|uniref:Uncharacterized protein n=1 Tax=Vibrio phage Ceto TaxID=2570300 RepID=A0A2H5BGL1_9CAUD|nr:hypothetical protein FDJ19_gp093 [Vibrio phage Ceto]AUG85100.1 hypothetical protein CETO_93 [Vibrio phage Ceto]
MGELPEWFERLLEEQRSLKEKIDKLQANLCAPADVPRGHLESYRLRTLLLTEQLSHMRAYENLLNIRINLYREGK